MSLRFQVLRRTFPVANGEQLRLTNHLSSCSTLLEAKDWPTLTKLPSRPCAHLAYWLPYRMPIVFDSVSAFLEVSDNPYDRHYDFNAQPLCFAIVFGLCVSDPSGSGESARPESITQSGLRRQTPPA
ncbi:unnamed protein product [Peniophora sp. CBMAI 1063]|nr:unnamed protein product [Peniophora sp. CBMAI 1063]